MHQLLVVARTLTSRLAGEGLRQQMLRGGIGSLAVKGGSILLALLSAVILARLLGPEGYGVYSYVFALVSLLAVPSQLGLPALVVRETARARALEEWGRIRAIWQWASWTAGSLSLVMGVAAAGVVWFASQRFSTVQVQTISLGLALVPLVALGNLRGAALRGLKKVVLGQLPEFIIRPSLMVAGALLLTVLFGWKALTPPVAMLIHVVAALISFAVGVGLLMRVRPPPLRTARRAPYQHREWLTAMLPLALLAGLQVVNQYVGILCLGIFGSAHDVGVYRVASQATLMITAGLQAVVMVAAPHFAHLGAIGETAKLRRLASLCALVSFGLGLPVATAYLLFGEPLLTIMVGHEFSQGYVPLSILSVGQLITAASGVAAWSLNMTGREKYTAASLGLAAIANLGLNLLLAPTLGLLGASIAAAASAGISGALLLWGANRHLRDSPINSPSTSI